MVKHRHYFPAEMKKNISAESRILFCRLVVLSQRRSGRARRGSLHQPFGKFNHLTTPVRLRDMKKCLHQAKPFRVGAITGFPHNHVPRACKTFARKPSLD